MHDLWRLVGEVVEVVVVVALMANGNGITRY